MSATTGVPRESSRMLSPTAGQVVNSHDSTHCENPECDICKLKRPFTLPKEIIDAVRNQLLVIFAGAGISTETKLAFKTTLYEDIGRELKIPDTEKVSFPRLMSLYCAQRNRRSMFHKIMDRFDYMKKFPEVYRDATRFHRELSTIPYIQEIVTTNWDDSFERECDAIPIVAAADFAAFSDIPGRKVFKIHGSISNYGSIVATEEDYQKCYRRLRTGLIGGVLKVLLASKTILFVGYSFQDEDFRRIYRLLSKEVNQLLPHCYVVTLDDNAKKTLASLNMNMTPIITDATYFVETLKHYLVRKKLMLSDRRFSGLYPALDTITYVNNRLTKKMDYKTHPEVIYSLAYQDGLKHAFEDIIGTMKSGRFSSVGAVRRMILSYAKMRRQFLHVRKYFDVAYIDGFMNGLAYLLYDDRARRALPLFYLFGRDGIRTFREYTRLASSACKLHKSAYAYARKIIRDFHLKEAVLHHTPFL